MRSYVGLTPGEHSSAERERRTGITKAGPQELRMCLVQAAWAAMRVNTKHPMVEWARQIADRRGRPVCRGRSGSQDRRDPGFRREVAATADSPGG